MEKKNVKRMILYIFCIVMVFLATTLLITATLVGDFELKEAMAGKLRAELVYIILIAFLALPVMLLLLAIAIRIETKRGQKKPKVLNVSGVSVNGGAATVVGAVKSSAPGENGKEGADEVEDETIAEAEEGKGRFCKLCNLDDIRVSLQRTSYDEHITLPMYEPSGIGPSTIPPSGTGRSSTTTSIPPSAAASMTSLRVARYV